MEDKNWKDATRYKQGDMDNFLYAMNKSLEDMLNTIEIIQNKSDYTEDDNRSLFYVTGCYIHATLDYSERVEFDTEYNQYISAFRYANNCLKHSREVNKLTDIFEFSFSNISFSSFVFSKKVIWKIINDKKRKDQFDCYKQFLDNKSVIYTSKMLKDILLNHSKLKN